MPIKNDYEFLEAFVGPCQHVGSRAVQDGMGRWHYKCMMHVTTRRGMLYRCNVSRPLTDAELRARR